jgi:uncharacterized protein
MRRDTAGRLVYSPTDLVKFHGSAFASWMDRFHLEHPGVVTPDPDGDEDKIIAGMGLAHEAAHLAAVHAAKPRVVEIQQNKDAFDRTVAAMKDGPDVVFQAALRFGDFAGYADFLERVDGPSVLGDFHYEISDTKLASSEKPSYLLQLCAYAEMLEAVQGRRPTHVHVILRGDARRTFRTDDFFFVYRAVKRAFLASMEAFDADHPPEPDLGGDWGRWTSEAKRRLAAADSLALVAGMRAGNVRKLRAQGIDTVAGLAASTVKRIPDLSPTTFERLRDQARLQLASRGAPLPAWKVLAPLPDDPRRGLALLPPPSPLDVYFDMEGYPLVEGGLEYLFGASTEGRGEPDYADWWAHDAAGERRAFEGFVRWVMERRRRDPTMHVYHYAAYERTALRRLMGRYGTCEAEVDDLLRANVLVDLYAVVREGLRIGTPSYSLKAIEVLYGRKREGEVQNAAASIVAYHQWLESGEGFEPASSPKLARIRDYNRDDCRSTRELLAWLRARQAEAGISWADPAAPDAEPDAPSTPTSPPSARALAVAATHALATEMLASVPSDDAERAKDPDRWRVTELLAHLLEFHRREAKPIWWSLFDRAEMDEDQRTDDASCLAGLEREALPPIAIKRSMGVWYRFDPRQETKARVGASVVLANHLDVTGSISEFDEAKGRVLLKFGPKYVARLPGGEAPERTSLLLHEFVSTEKLEQSILTTALQWHATGTIRPAIRDLLLRRAPRVADQPPGPLVRPGESIEAASLRLVRGLSESILCVQGPPGTGKTYTAARVIAALVKAGRRVGVTSNSHKAILNLFGQCAEAMGADFRCLKVAPESDDDAAAFAADHPGTTVADSTKAADLVAGHRLIGATAWFFAKSDVADAFDVLFVDEAGQVSLANLVAMAPSARSLVLLGDPMQLAQVMQGSHPGDSGRSALDHMLFGQATVHEDFGVFLPVTRRMHPSLCAFVSGAFYEDRLQSSPGAAHRIVRLPKPATGGGSALAPVEAGLLFLPVAHDGNGQRSDEEVRAIAGLVEALVGRAVTDEDGRPAGRLAPSDVLVVAPYNVQVRALEQRMPAGVRVGTVDKFQGQEARVAIVSLTASDGEAASRGLEFVLDRRRLNVAISRAMSLSIVVGSPSLVRARCGSVEQMRLVNTLCRIVETGAAVGA